MLPFGNKSDILDCLGAQKGSLSEVKQATVVLIDLPPVIHMTLPSRASDFPEYVDIHLAPYVKSAAPPNATRVNTLSDKYPEAELDLKAQAHSQRGTGPWTELGDHTPIPRRDWQKYLANKENKTEIFKFVGEKLVQSQEELSHLHIITSHAEHALSNQDHDKSFHESNNHIEVDTHLFLHLADAVRSGHSKAFIRTVDSDIVVLATALFK